MKSNRVLIVLGVIIGIVLAIALLTSFVLFMKQSTSCQVQLEEPKRSSKVLKNFITKDYKAIANIDGYVLFNDTHEYVPLELNNIELSEESNEQYLTLHFTCASIGILWRKGINTEWNMVTEYNVSINVAGKSTTKCIIEYPGIYVPNNEHFYCQQKYVFGCVDLETHRKQLLELVLYAIEFEIDGDPDMIKEGRFSKQPRVCE